MTITAEISEQLESLAPVSKQLDAETESVLDIIAQTEQRLRELKIDFPKWLDDLDESVAVGPMRSGNDGDKRYHNVTKRQSAYQIGYVDLKLDERFHDERRIACKCIEMQCRFEPGSARANDDDEYWEAVDVDQPAIALVDAPNHVRIEALAHLPKLVEALTERARTLLDSVEQAKSAIAAKA